MTTLSKRQQRHGLFWTKLLLYHSPTECRSYSAADCDDATCSAGLTKSSTLGGTGASKGGPPSARAIISVQVVATDSLGVASHQNGGNDQDGYKQAKASEHLQTKCTNEILYGWDINQSDTKTCQYWVSHYYWYHFKLKEFSLSAESWIFVLNTTHVNLNEKNRLLYSVVIKLVGHTLVA